MRGFAIVLVTLGVLLLGAACDDETAGSGTKQVGEDCTGSSDCAAGLECSASVCVVSADVSVDGGNNDTSTDSSGADSSDTSGTDALNDVDTSVGSCSGCVPGDICQDGTCVSKCDTDRVDCGGDCCASGEVCGGNGACAADCGSLETCAGRCCSSRQTCNTTTQECELACSATEKVCGRGESSICCSRRDACDSDGTCGTCPGPRVCGFSCCDEGDVCENDACLPACAGERCGDLCCTGSAVCIFNGCHVPGDACTSSLECPSNQYCDPSLSACLPKSINTEVCESLPDFGNFTPAKEGEFIEITVDGEVYTNSITTPVVADIDNDGRPEVATNFYHKDGLTDAVLVILNGEDMTVSANSAGGLIQPNSAGIAVGQLDASTPELEIVAIADGGGLVAFRADGSVWWTNISGNVGTIRNHSAPIIADMDGDGTPEVIVGFSVVSADGTTVIYDGGRAGDNFNQTGGITVVVDMDQVVNSTTGKRELELVTGNRVLRLDGSALWDVSSTIEDGYPAVADFQNNGTPDVVNVTDGQVYVLSGTDGSILFGPVAIPSGGCTGNNYGGPPTIADFDGDGFVEFATAGCGEYTVYDLDCQGTPDPTRCNSQNTNGILWSVQVQDLSSSATGSSVFDFDGDGKAEVVYNDECFLRVFDGTDGTVLYEEANSTRTGSENPIIVDVDGDFKAEIVVVSNNDQIVRDNCDANAGYPAGGTHGIFVYGDATDNWVPTRQMWNEHAYHITNVNDDGTIPAQEDIHYLNPVSNNFRLNTQGDGLFNAPDLVVAAITTDPFGCPSNLEIHATISNDGTLGVPAGVWLLVEAVDSNGTVVEVARVQTTTPILPGSSLVVTVNWTPPTSGFVQPFDLRVTIDDNPSGASDFRECREENNESSETGIECRVN